ncbi:MAG: gamma-glutamylcyclotransferase [Deltaproteobacteria bacterium]
MDRFFTQIFCDRCGGSLEKGRIMSMFNTDCICIACKERETKRSDYGKALQAEHEEVKKGNYNYKGIEGRDS